MVLLILLEIFFQLRLFIHFKSLKMYRRERESNLVRFLQTSTSASIQRSSTTQSNSEKLSQATQNLGDKMLNSTAVIVIVGVVICLVTLVFALCFYITYYQKKLKDKINRATNSEVRRQRREELE